MTTTLSQRIEKSLEIKQLLDLSTPSKLLKKLDSELQAIAKTHSAKIDLVIDPEMLGGQIFINGVRVVSFNNTIKGYNTGRVCLVAGKAQWSKMFITGKLFLTLCTDAAFDYLNQ